MLLTAFFTPSTHSNYSSSFNSSSIYTMRWKPAYKQVNLHPRAVLLVLSSGKHKIINEGINLRGDMNVCIAGDPNFAQSQFLRCSFVTLSMYVHRRQRVWPEYQMNRVFQSRGSFMRRRLFM
ncbi:hypothetical protein YC2023_041486 [Brassica napus]